MPTDRLAQLYDAGPFPAVEVPQFPAALVAQLERLTGQRFDVRLFETYERLRAFLDYPGVQITDALRAEQVLSDPVHDRPPAPPPTATSTPEIERKAAALGTFDPEDLGD